MNKAMTSLIAVGIGAAAYTMMRDRKNRKRVMNMFEPLRNMDLRKMMPKMR